jgi:hypothetical protein
LLASIESNNQQELYLCDRDAASPGIRIYDIATNVLLEMVDVGLPPYDVAFVQEPAPIGLTDGGAPARRARLGQNYPNPFNPRTLIPFTLADEARVRLDVFDVAGRKVATVIDRRLATGSHAVRWHGFTDAGTRASAGVFFYRLRAGEDVVTRKMVMAP